jgi:meso-butanediol dehydrogenase / (S,S)-butanediol dehydrogenase / diacetyl reductase
MGDRLKGKVAIVTGASNGVGEATARLFAEEGARVVLCARRQELLDAIVTEIQSEGGEALGVCADVTDETAVRMLVEQALAEYGQLDILVNNANALVPGMLADHDLTDWRKSFEIAVDAPMLMMREAQQHLASVQGAVVNVSSVCGDLATPGVAAYSAAKAGLQSLTRNAAIEWAGQGVRVNAIVIGIMMTPATEAAIPDEVGQKMTGRSVPLGRIGEPREAAQAILFLASDDASYITGVELNVDGGRAVELNAGTADWEE